jgi:eukaryotic-like serine/threonine-protein kinase
MRTHATVSQSMPHVDRAETDPSLGARVGDYVLLEQIGSGGMSNVYRARHLSLGREFAVKLIHPSRKSQPVFIERMRREALASMRVDHPNFIKVYEFGMSKLGPYIVMELLQGCTLHDVLRNEGHLAPVRCARIVRQIAAGLHAAHRLGLVHRDLKPGNLMIVSSSVPGGEQVKILDLGIVRMTGAGSEPHHEDDAPLTQDDLVVGTPCYMAPEQFQSSHVGPEADLYALGIVLYQMISGRLPFEGNFHQIMVQQLSNFPNPLPETGGLDELAFWLLDRTPGLRPTAECVIDVIDRRVPIANAFTAPVSYPPAVSVRAESEFVRIVPGQPVTPPPNFRAA